MASAATSSTNGSNTATTTGSNAPTGTETTAATKAPPRTYKEIR